MTLLVEGVVSAADIVTMLRRHYLPEGRAAGGIFAAEIESPDGRRRADAIWAPWSVAGDRGLVGHEVKASRSDVIAELADPMKAEPWARHCSRWWLVVAHPALVEGLEVPGAWGIMAPPSGRRTRSMTIVREAPALKAIDPGPGWRRIAAWEHYRLEERIRELDYQASRHKSDAERARRELAEWRASELGRRDPRAATIGRILDALDRELAGFWLGTDAIDADDIAAAVADLDAHRRLVRTARQEIQYLVDETRRLAAPMARVATELDKLAKGPRP